MLDVYNKRLKDERKQLTKVMNVCVRQVAAISIRRLENYHARQQMLHKQRQEHAATSIQARVRQTIGRNQRKREFKLQRIAAVLIQRQFRKQREREHTRRTRRRHLHDCIGTSFKHACRINQTFLLLNVDVNEIDSETNLLELELRGWHPGSGGGNAPAVLRIPCEELQRIVRRRTDDDCQEGSGGHSAAGDDEALGLTRRAIVDLVVHEHLDVFRSAKHKLLVLSLKM